MCKGRLCGAIAVFVSPAPGDFKHGIANNKLGGASPSLHTMMALNVEDE